MVGSEPDQARTPDPGLLSRCPLHQGEERQTVFAPRLIRDRADEGLDAVVGAVRLDSAHDNLQSAQRLPSGAAVSRRLYGFIGCVFHFLYFGRLSTYMNEGTSVSVLRVSRFHASASPSLWVSA